MQIREPKIINGETYLPCFQCKQLKKLDEFHHVQMANSGRSSNCKECMKIYTKKYRKEHPEESKKYRRKWRLNNREKNESCNRNWYSRTKNKITVCLRGSVSKHLNGVFDERTLWGILGYTYEEFIKHIEKQFQPGMNWNNHGEWEIDHIIPKDFFQFKSPEDVEFKMCWRLENLQPLWKEQNQKKGNKVLVA